MTTLTRGQCAPLLHRSSPVPRSTLPRSDSKRHRVFLRRDLRRGRADYFANQVNLKPGQRGTMVWQFTQPGKVDFACTEPGHLEAGMAGQVEVAR